MGNPKLAYKEYQTEEEELAVSHCVTVYRVIVCRCLNLKIIRLVRILLISSLVRKIMRSYWIK